MNYLQAILALFAIVDPVGNIPMFLHISEHVPQGQSRKAFNTAVIVGVIILLIFTFAGNWVMSNIFHINFEDLQLAGGILLLIIAIDHLIIGTLKRSVTVNGTLSAVELGCVPTACPLLAGPGAMVTCLSNYQSHGPVHAAVAIFTIFGLVWVIMLFLKPIHRFLGRLFCTVVSKVMCLFIAAIGVHMIMSGLVKYFAVSG
jgi:multiple antibiotic resistance protein